MLFLFAFDCLALSSLLSAFALTCALCVHQILDIQKAQGVYGPKKPSKAKAAAAASQANAPKVTELRAKASTRLKRNAPSVRKRRRAFIAHHFPECFASFVPQSVARKLDLTIRPDEPYIEVFVTPVFVALVSFQFAVVLGISHFVRLCV